MNVRNHASAILIGIATLTIVTTTVISTQLFSGMTAAVEEDQLDFMQAAVEARVRNTESRATTRAALFAELHDVRRLLAAQDREGLVAATHDTYQRQHDQFGLEVLAFQVPPATTLVRVQAPERPAEDVSSFRPSIVAANADHAPRHGIELGRIGASIVAVVPVAGPDGAHVGTVELGLDFGPMLDDLDESFGLDATFFVLERPLREVATGLDPAMFADDNRVGTHLKWYSTNWALTQSLVGAEDLGPMEEPVRYTRSADGVPYGVLLVPVRSIAGEPIGVISVARDFSSTRAAAGRSLVWQALLALFASVVIAAAILVVIRGMLLRPLARVSGALGELAKGQAGATITDVESMPDELQEIAKHHETMRARQALRTLYGPGESS